MPRLQARPISLRKANDFVAEHHRHSGRTARNGGKFAIACHHDGELVGVVIVGNPLCAHYMDGVTAEVTRLCTTPDAPHGTCSFLYGRSADVWRAMGGEKLITYTLWYEPGDSLRGAGWEVEARSEPHNRWVDKGDGRKRKAQAIYGEAKVRWRKRLVGASEDPVGRLPGERDILTTPLALAHVDDYDAAEAVGHEIGERFRLELLTLEGNQDGLFKMIRRYLASFEEHGLLAFAHDTWRSATLHAVFDHVMEPRHAA